MKQKFDYRTYLVFGYTVHHKRLASGDSYVVRVGADTTTAGLGNSTVFTKGRITGVDQNGVALPYERVPGFNTLSSRPVPEGVYTFTAQEDSEWWCFNHYLNFRKTAKQPKLELFSLEPDASTVLEVGTKLFLYEGDLVAGSVSFSSGDAVQIETAPISVVATARCYGLMFKE